MINRIAVCIIHAAHLPARKPPMDRLRNQILESGAHTRGTIAGYHEETTRGKWWVWHALSLEFFLRARSEWGATHALTLQDDVILSPNFFEQLDAMITARPNEIICLDCAHPGAREIIAKGHTGYTTPDGLIGIGHVEPIEVVQDFYNWRAGPEAEIGPERHKQITEDTLFALYAMAREKPIYCPVPCILDHDLDVGSTNEGNDDHWFRKPQVTWKDVDRFVDLIADPQMEALTYPSFWDKPAPHLGRFYDDLHEYLPLILNDKELAERLRLKYRDDVTPSGFDRFWPRAGAISA